MGENKRCTCQNPSCKATFTTPLKTINLQANPSEPYYACPYCLTEIEGSSLKSEDEPKQQKNPTIEYQSQIKQNSEKGDKPPACQFHLGYLSERVQKEQIPEGCLVCKSIVECMLKRMRGEQ